MMRAGKAAVKGNTGAAKLMLTACIQIVYVCEWSLGVVSDMELILEYKNRHTSNLQ